MAEPFTTLELEDVDVGVVAAGKFEPEQGECLGLSWSAWRTPGYQALDVGRVSVGDFPAVVVAGLVSPMAVGPQLVVVHDGLHPRPDVEDQGPYRSRRRDNQRRRRGSWPE